MFTRRDDDINLWDVLHAQRLALGPLYVGAAAAGAAVLTSPLGFDMSTPQTMLATGVTALAGTALAASTVKDKLRRWYTYGIIGASTSWVLTAHEMWASSPDWVGTLWFSGVVLAGLPWWLSSRKRAQVRMERNIQDWPNLAERIGLGHTKMVGVTVTSSGYRGILNWPRGMHEAESVIKRASNIEGALAAPIGSVRLDFNGRDPNSVKFSVVLRDPHAEAQLWYPPSQGRRAEDPVPVGIKENGEVFYIRRYIPGKGVRHMMSGGMTESGKSSLINLDVAECAISDDWFQIGFDFKHVELTPWKPILGYFTTSIEQARAVVRAIAAPDGVMDERASIIAEREGPRSWDPDIDGPNISIPIDEFRNLVDGADAKTLSAFVRIATEGRALGIRFNLATQYPIVQAIGSSIIREQILHRFCFRMQSESGEAYVLPGHRVQAHKIPVERPGTCYAHGDVGLERMPIRVFYLDDEMVKTIVIARAGRIPELDARSEAALIRHFPAFAERERFEVVPLESGTGAGAEGDSTGVAGTAPGLDRDRAGSRPGLEREPAGSPPGVERDWSGSVAGLGGTAPGVATGVPGVEREPSGTEAGAEPSVRELLASRRERMTSAERDQSDRDRERALAEMSGPKLGPQEARDMVIEMLRNGPESGLRATELFRAVGRSSSWFYAWKDEEPELFDRTSEGLWRLREATSGDSE